MLRQILFAVTACLGLAACYYESTVDLRGKADAYEMAAFMPVGQHLFVAQNGEQLLTLNIAVQGATVTRQIGGSAPERRTMTVGIASPDFPKNTFVAMTEGVKRDGVLHYQYFGFQYSQTHIRWIRPKETSKFSTTVELGRALKSDLDAERFATYLRVPDKDTLNVQAHFADLREKKIAEDAVKAAAKKAQTQSAPEPSVPPVAGNSVNGLTVGDGVYVQGWLEDEAAMIQAFDKSGKRVKVLRYSDGISEWVSTSSIISRGEAAANNVGRVGVGVGIMVCFMNPDLCKGQ